MATLSNKQTFSSYNVKNAPGAPGVYRLYHGSYICFYVGQVAAGTCYFDYAVISSKVERDQVEVQEINRLRPECNRQ